MEKPGYRPKAVGCREDVKQERTTASVNFEPLLNFGLWTLDSKPETWNVKRETSDAVC